MNKKNALILAILLVAIGVAVYAYRDVRPSDRPIDQGGTGATTSSAFILTQDYNGQTVTLAKGQRFAVELGEMNWTLSFDPQGVVSRVKNIAVVRGSQGVFTADNPGTTVLTAEGRPNCNPGEMCAQFIVNFKATLVVR